MRGKDKDKKQPQNELMELHKKIINLEHPLAAKMGTLY